MSERISLVSQMDMLELIAKYAQRYPTNSCDIYTRSTGNLLSKIFIDLIQNVPIRATLEVKGEANESCSAD